MSPVSKAPVKGSWSIDSDRENLKKKRGDSSSANCDTVIGARSKVCGKLVFSAGAQVDGAVEGELEVAGELLVGESAVVSASIVGERVQVFGKVVGDITATERIEVFAGAQITGNISSPRLVIHDGVVFDGHCRMEQHLQEDVVDIAEARSKREGLETSSEMS